MLPTRGDRLLPTHSVQYIARSQSAPGRCLVLGQESDSPVWSCQFPAHQRQTGSDMILAVRARRTPATGRVLVRAPRKESLVAGAQLPVVRAVSLAASAVSLWWWREEQ